MIKEIVEEEILRGVPMLNHIFVRVEGYINFQQLGEVYLVTLILGQLKRVNFRLAGNDFLRGSRRSAGCWFFNVLCPSRCCPIAS
jgi:hypothetical protein